MSRGDRDTLRTPLEWSVPGSFLRTRKRPQMNYKLEHKLAIGVGLAMVVLGCIGLAACRAAQRLLQGAAQLRAGERDALRRWEQHSVSSALVTLYLVDLGNGLTFVLIALSGLLVRRDVLARRRAEAALREARAQSEERAQVRTAELVA